MRKQTTAQAVRPDAVATGRRVEERWAKLTSLEEIESLRGSLQHLLTILRSQADADGASEASDGN